MLVSIITFRLGETNTMIDYILVNNRYRSGIKNVKVISDEEIVSQHSLLSMDSVLKKGQEESKIQKEIETVEVESWR